MNNCILPQDEAMQTFRRLFPHPFQKVVVSEDGTRMTMRIISDTLLADALKTAKQIIRVGGLPLDARASEWWASGLLLDRWLTISFVPQMSPLPCY